MLSLALSELTSVPLLAVQFAVPSVVVATLKPELAFALLVFVVVVVVVIGLMR